MTPQPRWTAARRNTIIDQQLWFLGRDIGGPLGNAPLAFGFERHRPAGIRGSSAYLLRLENPSHQVPQVLICWGFGLYIGADATCATDHRIPADAAGHTPTPWSGMLLQRFGASPGLVCSAISPTRHQVADLPARRPASNDADRASASALLRTLAQTLADYERWAITTLGSPHRTAALHAAPRHKRHRFLHTPELSEAWERWADVRCARVEPDVTLEPQRAVA